MKLFVFKPKEFGQTHFVMSETKEDALERLLDSLKYELGSSSFKHRSDYNTFSCTDNYTVEEYEVD